MGKIFRLKVWGEYALFTRVEAKVERVSYPVMTPSAARGILTGIFWKPEFKWRIKSIHVLKPIQYYSILRNEVASIVPSNIVTSKRDYFTVCVKFFSTRFKYRVFQDTLFVHFRLPCFT
ncbi:CRISPR-associated protein Cas5, partial [Heyndrickxia coagulans]